MSYHYSTLAIHTVPLAATSWMCYIGPHFFETFLYHIHWCFTIDAEFHVCIFLLLLFLFFSLISEILYAKIFSLLSTWKSRHNSYEVMSLVTSLVMLQLLKVNF